MELYNEYEIDDINSKLTILNMESAMKRDSQKPFKYSKLPFDLD